VERILNKQKIRGKDKYLVRWKGFTVELDTWEGKKNLEDVRRQEKKEGMFKRGELPGRFTAKKLFGWTDKRYNEEYWGRLERNWIRWKGSQWKRNQLGRRRIMLDTIKEEEEIEQENSEIREWIEEYDEIGNMVDPHYEL